MSILEQESNAYFHMIFSKLAINCEETLKKLLGFGPGALQDHNSFEQNPNTKTMIIAYDVKPLINILI